MNPSAKIASRFVILCKVLVLTLSVSVPAKGLETDVQTRTPRIFHFVLRRVDSEKVYWMTDLASKAGFNTIQVVVTDGVQFENSPWLALDDAWTKQEFKDWVAYTRSKGMQIVPEVKLLTHQERFFQNFRDGLMYNKSTYDPRNEGTYKVVFDLLEEIIETIQPHALHIGHDEVAGHSKKSAEKWLRTDENILPAELFVQDVLRVHEYLQQKGIETWIWSDMLVSPQEFPDMLATHLHGSTAGYGKALRDRIPREIVLCDWHYFDKQEKFDTVDILVKDGFRVIGATWKRESTMKKFSRFAADHGAHGMMVTTWYLVQKKQWEDVENIIREAGQTFGKHFPDND